LGRRRRVGIVTKRKMIDTVEVNWLDVFVVIAGGGHAR
jgi:hypothetical protein